MNNSIFAQILADFIRANFSVSSQQKNKQTIMLLREWPLKSESCFKPRIEISMQRLLLKEIQRQRIKNPRKEVSYQRLMPSNWLPEILGSCDAAAAHHN